MYDSNVDKREVRVVDVEERAEDRERRDVVREARPDRGRGFSGGGGREASFTISEVFEGFEGLEGLEGLEPLGRVDLTSC